MIPKRRRVLKLWQCTKVWALACAGLMALPLPADQIGLSWNGGTGNWSNPANWTPNDVPNNGADTYSVLIASGALDVVNLDITARVDALTLGSMTTLNT